MLGKLDARREMVRPVAVQPNRNRGFILAWQRRLAALRFFQSLQPGDE
ncbi:hypothetical protein BH20ACI3_BH20ACI3_29920 [soil metagenome]